MRMLTGAVLILAAEQAFAHAHMANFPNEPRVRDVLYPACIFLVLLGSVLLVWGLVTDRKGKVEGAS
ncbi:MAG: hypothetical protein U0935_15375 [Pirellulales bacterium]